jgi:cysteine synthase A
MIQEKLGADAVVVTVFSDDNKKYLSTDLMRQEPIKPGFLSPDIELISVKVIKRTCYVCCKPSECIEKCVIREVDSECACCKG